MPASPIGIDLGTTFSVVARVDSHGVPRTIPNSEGDLTTPSVVLFDRNSIVVGKEAVKAATVEPSRIAQFVKREMGGEVYSQAINGEFYPPEVIQSLILEKLKRDAEAKLGPVEEAVITVPAYFNEPRRKATQDAGRMAGLKVLDIINEPTAAALAYGAEAGFLSLAGEAHQPETLLIYDLGGGTFDVSVLCIEGKSFRVLATDGNVKLGGLDWDQRLVDYLADEFTRQHGMDPRNDPGGFQRLLKEAEEAKRSLTAREQLAVTFEHAGRSIRPPVTRAQFEELTAGLLERTRFTVHKVLQDANLRWGDINRILLVGGSTRMPQVGEMLERESGKTVDRSLAADEAVAHGAAIYADLLKSSQTAPKRVAITNVNSHNLGVLGVEPETGRPRAKVMIPRNSALPTSKAARFQTRKANQQNVVVNVIEGGDASGNESTPIGRCVVTGLPAELPAGTRVEVSFSYGNNGRLTVKAAVPNANLQAEVEIERSAGLEEAEIDAWGRRVRNGMRPLQLED